MKTLPDSNIMDNEYTITEQKPLVEEFLAIRTAVQWCNPAAVTAAAALEGSLYCVCIRHGDQLVAFGRVIGDGSFIFYIQDMIVVPEYQGKGLGKTIMHYLMRYIDSAGGEDAVVGLMAAKGVVGFYQQFEFTRRPAEGPGMQRLPEFRRHRE